MIPASEVLASDLEGSSWTTLECFSSVTVSTTSEFDILAVSRLMCPRNTISQLLWKRVNSIDGEARERVRESV